MSPENAIYNVIAYLIRAYTGFDCEVRRTITNYVIRIKKVPIYGEKKPGDVDFHIPMGHIAAGRTMIKIKTPINSREVKIEWNGKSYRHPHIFDDKTPCWNGAIISDLTSLFEMIVMTTLWTNVTTDSGMIGHYTSCECTRMMNHDFDSCINGHKVKLAAAAKRMNEPPGQFFSKRFPEMAERAVAVA